MTTFAWPTDGTDKAFLPKLAELRQAHNNRELTSPLSGDVQTNSVPGARWGWVLTFAPQTWPERGRLWGFLTRLNGKQHRAALFDPARAVPLGTLALSGITASGSAAQFATSITLAGCKAAGNLLAYSSKLEHSSWTKNNASIAANAGADPLGGTEADKLVESLDAPGVPMGHSLASPAITVPVGSAVSLSWSAKPAGRDWLRLQVTDVGNSANAFYAYFNAATGAIGSQIDTGTATLTGATAVSDGIGWYRFSVSGVADSAATSVRANVYLQTASSGTALYEGDGASGVLLHGARLELGGTPAPYGYATLLAGDWFAVGGQLLQCVADAVATTDDLMVVEFRHPLRASIAGGAAITLDHPTALYILTESELGTVFQSARAHELAVAFREVFT